MLPVYGYGFIGKLVASLVTWARQKLILGGSSKLTINVFVLCSGDEDAMVPVSGTRLWLKKLGLKIRKPWYPWVNGGQVCKHL